MANSDAATRHVLVCDDDDLGREMVGVVLEDGGFRVSQARDGEAGLSVIRSLKPAIVLLDLDMPVKTGLDVLRDLQQTPAHPAPEVVVLTHHENAALQDLCRLLGARATIVKPFSMPELLGRLEELLRERDA